MASNLLAWPPPSIASLLLGILRMTVLICSVFGPCSDLRGELGFNYLLDQNSWSC